MPLRVKLAHVLVLSRFLFPRLGGNILNRLPGFNQLAWLICENFVRQRRGAAARQTPQMENQKAVQKPAQLGGLGGRGLQSQTCEPVALRQCRGNFFCSGGEAGLLPFRLQPDFAQHFEFKGKNSLRREFLPAQTDKKFAHQFINGGQGRAGFCDLLDERRGVSGLAQPADVLTQRAVCLAQADFTERVQIGTAAAAER